jgi:Short C-terminal domain
MMRRRMGHPGLVGTMARTAVIAGTATAVAGGVNKHQAGKAQEAATQDAAQQAAFDSQQQMAEMQQQMAEMQAQQAAAAAAAAPPPPPAPAAAPAGDLMGELSKLADLKAAGVLTDEEFSAAKAKLLG